MPLEEFWIEQFTNLFIFILNAKYMYFFVHFWLNYWSLCSFSKWSCFGVCTPVDDELITELVENYFNDRFITINPINRFSPTGVCWRTYFQIFILKITLKISYNFPEIHLSTTLLVITYNSYKIHLRLWLLCDKMWRKTPLHSDVATHFLSWMFVTENINSCLGSEWQAPFV